MKGRMQRNLVLLFLGASALPLATVTGVGYVSSTRAVVSMIRRQTEFSCGEIEGRFARQLRRLQDQFLLTAKGHGALPEPWGERVRLRGDEVEYYVDDLLTIVGPEWIFTSVSILDAAGRPRYKVDYQSSTVTRDGRASHFLQEANFRPEDRVATDVALSLAPSEIRLLLPDAGSGTMVVRLMTPLFSGGRRLGLLAAEFDANRLLESMVAGMSLGTDGYFFLVDSRTDVVLAHPDFEKRNQLLQMAMPALGEKPFGSDAGWKRFQDEGRDWILSYRRLPETPWICVVAAPVGTFLAPIRRVGWLSLGLVTVVLGTTAVVIFLGTRRFRTALTSLTSAADGFSAGELDRRVEVGPDDEMGALGATFNRMATQLQHDIARREESARFESFHRLSAALAHDLKSSLFSLSLLTDNMDRHMGDPEFLQDSAATIRQTLEKMKRTSARLLDRRSRTDLQKEPCDLSALASEALRESGVADHPSIRVETDLHEDVRALVDPTELRRLLGNLLHNAADAMPEGGTLRLECRRRDGEQGLEWADIVVRDTGTGMSPQFLEEKLFRPFATTKARGIGLGLHDCREIAERHQGRIDVDSEVGHGSTFTVRLPAIPTGP